VKEVKKMNKIILATGSEDLNNAVIEFASKQYSFEQVHYREFLLEESYKFNLCIISKLLPGEIEFDKLIYMLRNRDIRVILILLEESKEELEICIKYHITDVLTQPIKPVDILQVIETPKTFKDIEFIYKKVDLNIDLDKDTDNSKKNIKREPRKNIISEKPVKEIVKYKQSLIGANNIGVISLSHGAGATFFTLNFAKAISEFTKVAVVEYPLIKPKIYNTIGISNYIDEIKDYVSYAHIIKDNTIDQNSTYINDDMTFIVTDPNREEITDTDWDENKMLRLLYVSKMPINIIDLGNRFFDSNIINIIEQFSCVILIIDPYVPNVLENIQMLEKIKKLEENKNLNIKYIINKFNDGVDETELLNNLDIYPIAYIPFIDPQHIYLAAHKNKIPYGIKDVREVLQKPFDKLIKDIIPEEMNHYKKKKSLFKFFK